MVGTRTRTWSRTWPYIWSSSMDHLPTWFWYTETGSPVQVRPVPDVPQSVSEPESILEDLSTWRTIYISSSGSIGFHVESRVLIGSGASGFRFWWDQGPVGSHSDGNRSWWDRVLIGFWWGQVCLCKVSDCSGLRTGSEDQRTGVLVCGSSSDPN